MSKNEVQIAYRRRRVRQYLRQGLTQVEIAKRLGVNVTTVNEDVSEISNQNGQSLAATKIMTEKDTENLWRALVTINQLEEEAWKVYYGSQQIVRREKRKNEEGEEIEEEVIEEFETPLDSKTKLAALEQLRKCNDDRAKLLKLLGPAQINIGQLNYVHRMVPIFVTQVIQIATEFIPEDKHLAFLERMEQVDIEGGLNEK